MFLFLWFKTFIIVLLILWTVMLLYFWRSSILPDNINNESVDKLRNQLRLLEEQYSNIKDLTNVIKDVNRISVPNSNNLHINNKSFLFGISKDPIEEMLRRRTHSNLMELLYTVLDKEKKKTIDIPAFFADIQHRLLSLISDVELISETVISQSWRKKELIKLGDLIQHRIEQNQNPKSCVNAKKITCNLNKGCGFGCQIHHVVYCMILAYSTQRTLLLDSNNWRYGSGGWNSVFQPLSRLCTYDKIRMRSVNWGEPNMETAENILVPIVDTLSNRPDFLPQAIPSDIFEKISMLHGDPFAWFVGQILSYVMRLSEEMGNFLNNNMNKQYSTLFTVGPIVGMHIRRTDKVGTEAQYHSLQEYMNHVERYFIKEEIKANFKRQLEDLIGNPHLIKRERIQLRRQVVIATDEPNIFEEMKLNYPQYHVIGNRQNSQTANVNNRYTTNALKAIIIDTMYLSQTHFLVCTFSSQVCRVAYELMQTHVLTSADGDQGNKFRSLDDIYYFGGQHANRMIMIQDHESDLKTGDILNVMGNHWNGWSKGSSTPNNVCLFPTYKAQFLRISREMGKYNQNEQ